MIAHTLISVWDACFLEKTIQKLISIKLIFIYCFFDWRQKNKLRCYNGCLNFSQIYTQRIIYPKNTEINKNKKNNNIDNIN